MTGRACKAAICCSKAVVACERVGWDELASQVRQIDKTLQTQISGVDVYSERQLAEIIDIGEAIYDDASAVERAGRATQSEYGTALADIVLSVRNDDD